MVNVNSVLHSLPYALNIMASSNILFETWNQREKRKTQKINGKPEMEKYFYKNNIDMKPISQNGNSKMTNHLYCVRFSGGAKAKAKDKKYYMEIIRMFMAFLCDARNIQNNTSK